MPPSDKTSDEIPTWAAKKLAQVRAGPGGACLVSPGYFFLVMAAHSRQPARVWREGERRVAADLKRVLDAACPLWPGERKLHVLFRHFSLDPLGLDLSEAKWQTMDWL